MTFQLLLSRAETATRRVASGSGRNSGHRGAMLKQRQRSKQLPQLRRIQERSPLMRRANCMSAQHMSIVKKNTSTNLGAQPFGKIVTRRAWMAHKFVSYPDSRSIQMSAGATRCRKKLKHSPQTDRQDMLPPPLVAPPMQTTESADRSAKTHVSGLQLRLQIDATAL